jgi:hypothetical protein
LRVLSVAISAVLLFALPFHDSARGQQARAASRPAARTGSTYKPTGVPACDRYLRFYRCFIKQLPASARNPATAAYQKMLQAWQRSIRSSRSSPTSLAGIARGCRSAMRSLKKALRNNQKALRCLQRLGAAGPPDEPPPKKARGSLRGLPHCDLFQRRLACFLRAAPTGIRREMKGILQAWRRRLRRLRRPRRPGSKALAPEARRRGRRFCRQADAALRRRIGLHRTGLRCLQLKRLPPPRARPRPASRRRSPPRRRPGARPGP